MPVRITLDAVASEASSAGSDLKHRRPGRERKPGCPRCCPRNGDPLRGMATQFSRPTLLVWGLVPEWSEPSSEPYHHALTWELAMDETTESCSYSDAWRPANPSTAPGFRRVGDMSALQAVLQEHRIDVCAMIAREGIPPGTLAGPENLIRVERARESSCTLCRGGELPSARNLPWRPSGRGVARYCRIAHG